MELEKLGFDLTVCKVRSLADINTSSGFFFIGRTEEELSLVCRTEDAPSGTAAREDGWKGFRVRGVLDFSLVGILAELSGVLAEHGISVFAVSTYNTDYLLVREASYEQALAALSAAGWKIV